MLNNIIPQEFFTTDSTFDNYHLGMFYRDYVLQKQYNPYQFDGWNDKKNYGLLDNSGFVVYPKYSSLKEYLNDNGVTQKNLFFVSDAFAELKKFQQNLFKNNKLSSNNIFLKLNAYHSTEDAPSLYLDYVNKIYSVFKNTIIKDLSITKNVNNIHSFMGYFIKFINAVTKNTIFNRSAFIKSGLVPTSINGLRISIDQQEPIIDYRVSANLYMSNPYFSQFLETSAKFGFYVDKNVPWVLVADLESPTMQKYMEPYGVKTTNQIFDNFYFKAYTADLESLKNVILSFWNGYASIVVDNQKTELIESCNSMFAETNTLRQIDIATFEKYFDINWQLRLYLYIRILEEKFNITQNKFEYLHKESCTINKVYGTEKSLFYINTKLQEFNNKTTQQRLGLTNSLDSSIVTPEKQKGSSIYNLNF